MKETTNLHVRIASRLAPVLLALIGFGCSGDQNGTNSGKRGSAGSGSTAGSGSGTGTSSGAASAGSSGAPTTGSSGAASAGGTAGGSGSSSSSSGLPNNSGTATSGGSGGAGTRGAMSSSGSAEAGVGGSSGGSSAASCGIAIMDAGSGSLPPPAAGMGAQFTTPATDVQPGQTAAGYCEFETFATATNIVGFESLLSEGVDELVVYKLSGAAPAQTGMTQACSISVPGLPLYIAEKSGQMQNLTMPTGVGLPIAAGTSIEIYERVVNTGTGPVSASVQLNVLSAPAVQFPATAMSGFNTSVDIPAATASGPGSQTVTGTCTPPPGAQFFWMATMTGSHATSTAIKLVSGGNATEVVHTGTEGSYPADQVPDTGADGQHPGVAVWCPPLKANSGDSFAYSCSYTNTTGMAVTVGNGPNNETCLPIGYFFGGNGTPTCH